MMWKLDFRPDTLAWLLGITVAVGLGIHGVEYFRGRDLHYPLAVVEHDPGIAALKARADSMMAMRHAAEAGPVNINTATAAQFESLDGIGPVLAARIVDYRLQHGPFHVVDDLGEVSGIGPKRLEALRGRCYVDTMTAR